MTGDAASLACALRGAAKSNDASKCPSNVPLSLAGGFGEAPETRLFFARLRSKTIAESARFGQAVRPTIWRGFNGIETKKTRVRLVFCNVDDDRRKWLTFDR